MVEARLVIEFIFFLSKGHTTDSSTACQIKQHNWISLRAGRLSEETDAVRPQLQWSCQRSARTNLPSGSLERAGQAEETAADFRRL